MASEPERPIEKLLREAARKRRDEAPASFEPHPATRRLLQGEVARRYPQAGHGASHGGNWFRRVIPKLSWAVASMAVVAICVWVLSPRSSHKDQEQLFARNESAATPAQPPIAAPVAESDRRLQPAVASDGHVPSATLAKAQPSLEEKEPSITAAPGAPSMATAREGLPSVALAKKTQGLRSDFTQAGTSVLDVTTAALPPLVMAEHSAKSEIISTDLSSAFADKSLASTTAGGVAQPKDNAPTANLISGFAQNQPTPAAAAAAWQTPGAPIPGQIMTPPAEAAPPPAMASSLALPAVTNSVPNVALAQHFVRNIPKSKTVAGQAQPPDQRMLVSFQVEQNGSELRVKDEDGSVYLGYLQPAETATVVRDVMKAVPATAGRASNFKLADSVAQPQSAAGGPQTYFFRVAGTNQTLKLPVLFTGSISNAPGYGLSPTQLSGAKISGRVWVGTQREFEVLASPR